MASNDALQVNEGLLGDPPYLTKQDGKDVELTSRLPDDLMGEAPPPDISWHILWESLSDNVERLAISIMDEGEPQPWDTLCAKTVEKLLEIAPTTAKRFWADRYNGYILITAWLWRIITDGCLCNPGRYDTPGWEAFGTLDAILSRRAGTIDGAIRPPLPGTGAKTNQGPLLDAITTAFGQAGAMQPYQLEYRYHQWRALTYGMLRHDEAVAHTSPDRLARAIVDAVRAAFDLDDYMDGSLETSAAGLAAEAVAFDGYFLITRGNFMPTYRLPNRTEGDIIGRPFHKSVALARCKAAHFGDQGEPIDMVVAPGIFETGHPQMKYGYWVGRWLAPLRVCAGYDKSMSAEPVPATSPEGGQGESTRNRKRVEAEAEDEGDAAGEDHDKGMLAEPAPTTSPEGGPGEPTAAPRTRKRVKAEAEGKGDATGEDHDKGMSAEPAPATSPEAGQGEPTAGPRTRQRVKAEAEEKERAAKEVQEEENTRAKGKAKPKPKPKPKSKRKAAAKGRKK